MADQLPASCFCVWLLVGRGCLYSVAPDKLPPLVFCHFLGPRDVHRAQFGTTGMMPTLITDKIAVMKQAADVIAQAIAEKMPSILGIHFEGPHLSLAKKGTHCAELIRPISEAEWQVLSRNDIGQVMVTIAPETVAVGDIKRMVKLGIKVCLGHTNADYSTAQQAVDAGATGFTHFHSGLSLHFLPQRHTLSEAGHLHSWPFA